MIIYYIKNKLNNKMYIGQSIHSLSWRINGHLQCVKRGLKRKLYNAIRKYGWDNFEYGVICNCESLEELNQKETEYIIKFDTYKHGYNMGLGGDNNVMFSEETKQKHNSVMKTNEVRSKISESMKKLRQEKGFSEETRNKISEKLKGNKHFEGKHHNPESLKKIIQAKYKKVHCKNDNLDMIFNNVKEACLWWQQNGNSLKHWRSIANDIKKSNDKNVFVKGLIWEYI